MAPLLSQPSIHVLMDQGTVFLHPSPSPELPTNDPLLRGVVQINLPRPKRIKSLSVRLMRYINVCFPDYAYEFSHAVQTEVRLTGEKGERLYEKGTHSFGFTLVVPSSAAPYERSQYGRVYYKILATAKGDGLMGMDLTAERDVHIVVNPADEGEMQDLDVRVEGFHPEIGPWGTIVTSQHLTVGGFLTFDFFLASPPMDMRLLSVSAYLHTSYGIKSVEYPSQPEQLVKHKKRLFLVDAEHPPAYQTETAELNESPSPPYDEDNITTPPSPISPLPTPDAFFPADSTASPEHSRGRSASLPAGSASTSAAQRRFSLPSRGFAARRTSSLLGRHKPVVAAPAPVVPLRILPQGKTYQMSHLAQLPGDDAVRPSTHIGTKTPLRVSHDIVFEARFQSTTSSDESKVRVLKVERPIVISSCCCAVESLLVPSYSEVCEPVPRPPAYRHVGSSDTCACGRISESLAAQRDLFAARLRESVERTGDAMPRTKAEYRPVVPAATAST